MTESVHELTVDNPPMAERVARHLDGHLICDWGDGSDLGRQVTYHALQTGEQRVCTYNFADGVRIWVFTEAGRSVVILMPSDG